MIVGSGIFYKDFTKSICYISKKWYDKEKRLFFGRKMQWTRLF